MNLDPRAVVHNTEIGVVLTSREIAQGMGNWFDENIEKLAFRLELKRDEGGRRPFCGTAIVDGTPQTFDVDPYTGFWKRLASDSSASCHRVRNCRAPDGAIPMRMLSPSLIISGPCSRAARSAGSGPDPGGCVRPDRGVAVLQALSMGTFRTPRTTHKIFRNDRGIGIGQGHPPLP